ncbi:MarR family winged helix-turn-helix transcriptional regulator [Undibacter mobilis]|uniref:MarR family transcriptional regulator n=1 Tax=Undibacter mobilis TaxID=2292256 RepID=A0A371BB19_9BRAD|nr:MarR family transcriptional regulator [Undibacter mobilis]RDV04697.1 MarR family transcriptional regulator [Undibacter mobilis]
MLDSRPPLTTSREDFLKDGSDQLFREAIYTWVRSVEQLLKCRSAFAKISGLTSSQFAVLMGVASQQGSQGVTIKDLAEHVALASTHVTTEVGRLKAKGLVLKKSNLNDQRSVLVQLSRKGEQHIERVTPYVRTVNDMLFQNVSLHGLVRAHIAAKKLVDNSGEALAYLRDISSRSAKKPRSGKTTGTAATTRNARRSAGAASANQ